MVAATRTPARVVTAATIQVRPGGAAVVNVADAIEQSRDRSWRPVRAVTRMRVYPCSADRLWYIGDVEEAR